MRIRRWVTREWSPQVFCVRRGVFVLWIELRLQVTHPVRVDFRGIDPNPSEMANRQYRQGHEH